MKISKKLVSVLLVLTMLLILLGVVLVKYRRKKNGR